MLGEQRLHRHVDSALVEHSDEGDSAVNRPAGLAADEARSDGRVRGEQLRDFPIPNAVTGEEGVQ